jgi:UDPglucose 6-dehydrogenase
MPRAKQLMPTLTYAASTEEALKGADVAVILTEWADFRTLDLKALKNTLAQPVLIDLRNLFTSAEAKAAGLEYFPLGRPA